MNDYLNSLNPNTFMKQHIAAVRQVNGHLRKKFGNSIFCRGLIELLLTHKMYPATWKEGINLVFEIEQCVKNELYLLSKINQFKDMQSREMSHGWTNTPSIKAGKGAALVNFWVDLHEYIKRAKNNALLPHGVSPGVASASLIVNNAVTTSSLHLGAARQKRSRSQAITHTIALDRITNVIELRDACLIAVGNKGFRSNSVSKHKKKNKKKKKKKKQKKERSQAQLHYLKTLIQNLLVL